MKKTTETAGHSYTGPVIDVAVKLGTLALVFFLCLRILSPFVAVILWAVIIAVVTMPLFSRLSERLGNRKKLSAIIITFALLLVILLPVALFAGSLADGIIVLRENFEQGKLVIPPPAVSVKEIPVIGGMIFGIWEMASENLSGLAEKYSEEILTAGTWALGALMNTGLGMVLFLVSIVISGALLATSEGGAKLIHRLFIRLAGERGDEFFMMSALTIRNVAKEVIGIAFIQALLAGIIFIAAGVPYAGLWALLCLILGIIQVGPGPVIVPVMVYIFYDTTFWASMLWTSLLSLVMVVDNVLKPLLMGKGASVPMLVVFLGSTGGFMAFGFIGLFAGAILLSLGYKLFIAWLEPTI
ncbi:MAG: AI-2E family transporter [Bacteroidales bacterium]|nr:AI-2E family transporter [Bacteroidales bacterium]